MTKFCAESSMTSTWPKPGLIPPNVERGGRALTGTRSPLRLDSWTIFVLLFSLLARRRPGGSALALLWRALRWRRSLFLTPLVAALAAGGISRPFRRRRRRPFNRRRRGRRTFDVFPSRSRRWRGFRPFDIFASRSRRQRRRYRGFSGPLWRLRIHSRLLATGRFGRTTRFRHGGGRRGSPWRWLRDFRCLFASRGRSRFGTDSRGLRSPLIRQS